jgi:hypothetical protein
LDYEQTLAGSEIEIDQPAHHANKVLHQGSTAFLIYMDVDFFPSHDALNRCYLTFFHIPERFNWTGLNLLAGSPKELN